MSICRDAVPCNNDCPFAGYCQNGERGTYCVGTYQPEQIIGLPGGNGVILEYSEPRIGRLGRVFAMCDPVAWLVTDITAVSPTDLKGYEFYFLSYDACSITSPQSCKITASDGSAYDLSALQGSPISATDKENLWTYTVSVCSNQVLCKDSPAGYCQTGPQIYSVGNFGQITGKPDGKGVDLMYWDTNNGRVGHVNITCNPGGPLVGDKVAISPSNILEYEFNFSSSAACPVPAVIIHREP